jgi:hypothetical protein
MVDCVGEKEGAHNGYSYCQQRNGVARVLGHRWSCRW